MEDKIAELTTKSKIIELATERKTEENLAQVGAEYFKEVDTGLPIYGTIDPDSGIMVVVVRAEVQNVLMQVLNKINQDWKTNAEK